MFDGDGFSALGLEVVEEFSDALLDVVGYFLATLLLQEVVAQGFCVVAQEFVSIRLMNKTVSFRHEFLFY